MIRPLFPLLLMVVASMLPACATRYRVPSRTLGTSVAVVVNHDAADRTLRVEVSAGSFPVVGVALVDGRGVVRRPDAAVQQADELRGGVRLGGGVGLGGFGGGYEDHSRFRVRSGVDRTVGGRLVPGPYVARFLDPPLGSQPWTLRVTTGGEPRVRTDVLLAELENRTEVEADPAVALLLKLPTGARGRFALERGPEGGRLYRAMDANPQEQGDR